MGQVLCLAFVFELGKVHNTILMNNNIAYETLHEFGISIWHHTEFRFPAKDLQVFLELRLKPVLGISLLPFATYIMIKC